MHQRLRRGGDVVGGAAFAGALVVAVDGLAVAVLHPVDQGRLDLEAAVGQLGVGGDHLVERGLAGAERVAEQMRHVVVDAEALAVLRHGIHAHVLGDADGHQVARVLDAGAHGRRAVVGVARVLRPPDSGAGCHLDRGVEHDGGRAVAAVEGGGVDEGLERGAWLAQRLGGAVEDARLIGEAALHGEDAAGLGVHGHEAALDRRDLAVGPVVESAVIFDRLDEDHIAHVPHVVRPLRLAQAAAVGAADARPAGVGEAEELAVGVLGHALDADADGVVADGEDHRRAPAVDVAGHLGGGEGAAPAGFAGGIEARRVDPGHRAAIDADPAVVLLEPVTERARRHRLQVGIDRGADREAAGEEFVVAELLRELAADLVGEVVARRHFRCAPRRRRRSAR